MDKERLEMLQNDENFTPQITGVVRSESLLRQMLPELTSCDGESVRNYLYQFTDKMPIGLIEDDLNFNFIEFISGKQISTPANVFISYHFLDDIDLVNLKHFSENFVYFWYPAAEDILIIADDFDWRILITHYGQIFLSRNDRAGAPTD